MEIRDGEFRRLETFNLARCIFGKEKLSLAWGRGKGKRSLQPQSTWLIAPPYNPLEGGEGINSLVGNYSMSGSFALPRTKTGSKSKPRSYNSLSLWLVQNRWRERWQSGNAGANVQTNKAL